jgi:hypothetical protein
MKKFGFADGKGLGKQEQGTKDPIPFIKNYDTKGMGTRNVVHGMKQLGVKNYDNQVRYNTPIKFKSTQVTTHAPQSKANTKPNKLSKKPKPQASQDSFYADYVLTWNHKGKVVAKYVRPRTKGTLIKRNVWVPKCHTRFSEENQVLNYMYARIKFHTYSDIIVNNRNNIT